MKKLLVYLVALGSLSSFAAEYRYSCNATVKYKKHGVASKSFNDAVSINPGQESGVEKEYWVDGVVGFSFKLTQLEIENAQPTRYFVADKLTKDKDGYVTSEKLVGQYADQEGFEQKYKAPGKRKVSISCEIKRIK